MQIKIRNNVFETNSSSMHSIVINAENKENNEYFYNKNNALKEILDLGALYDKNKNIIDLTPLKDTDDASFGWGIQIYTDFAHKMLYAIGSYQYDLTILQEILEVLCDFFQVNKIIVPKSYYDDYSSKSKVLIQDLVEIDHQSTGTLEEFISTTNRFIIDFIKDPNIMLIIDNDNH